MAAVHRGFSTFKPTEYRNHPLWQIPIELKRRLPHLQVICDPSHICGRRDTLQKVAQKALDLNFDGLMIETHIQPDLAWSDAAQQITPEQLTNMLLSLSMRSDASPASDELETLRRHIDELDYQILDLLGRRMEQSRHIGAFKREHNMPLFQPERWQEVYSTRTAAGLTCELSNNFLRELLNALHKESIRQQEKMLKAAPQADVAPPDVLAQP
jgi:chorismate mutase